jgi:hypothetical protein
MLTSEGLLDAPDRRFQRYVSGDGVVEAAGGGLRLLLDGAHAGQYSDAQIDDYAGLARRRFPWNPPLRLETRVRFSESAASLRGTAGFGFWNDPFMMTGRRVPALPRAIWFIFASLPSDMRLDLNTPGQGWKAATIDASRPITGLLAPAAPLAIALMNLRPVHRAMWPTIQRAIKVQESAIDLDMRDWHTYSLDWGREASVFYVDGEIVLAGAPSPRGPLGFVMWLDNQFMVATPWGRFRWGMLDVPDRQAMEVANLSVRHV